MRRNRGKQFIEEIVGLYFDAISLLGAAHLFFDFDFHGFAEYNGVGLDIDVLDYVEHIAVDGGIGWHIDNYVAGGGCIQGCECRAFSAFGVFLVLRFQSADFA